MGESSDPSFLQGCRTHLLRVKWSENEVKSLEDAIKKHGGTLAEVPYVGCDVVVTALTSAVRVEKQLVTDKLRVPVVNDKWLHDCIAQGRRLAFDAYRFQFAGCPDPASIPDPSREGQTSINYKKRSTDDEASDDDADRTDGHRSKKLNVGSTVPHLETHVDMSSSSSDDEKSGDEDDDDASSDEAPSLAPGYVNSKYVCMNPCPLVHFNKKLVDELAVIENAREIMGEARSALSYRRAISALKSYPRDVKRKKEAEAIENIGPKIANMVEEFHKTGSIREADNVRDNSKYDVLEELMNIYGVGASTARHWYGMGYRSVEEVVENQTLSEVQLVGVKYIEDFKQKLSRPQVESVIRTVRSNIEQLQPGCVIDIVGGYRRGKLESGDVDIIISHPDDKILEGLLQRIISHFTERGNILYVLSVSTGHAVDRWTGSTSGMDALDKAFVAWREEGDPYARRVDFITPPWNQRVCAILGWMGSRQYERSIRDYAKKKCGYRLSSHTLFKIDTQEVVPVESEEDIYRILKLPHHPPELRHA